MEKTATRQAEHKARLESMTISQLQQEYKAARLREATLRNLRDTTEATINTMAIQVRALESTWAYKRYASNLQEILEQEEISLAKLTDDLEEVTESCEELQEAISAKLGESGTEHPQAMEMLVTVAATLTADQVNNLINLATDMVKRNETRKSEAVVSA